MNKLLTTTQDSLRDQCIEAYVGFESFVSRLVERAREDRGQTAAEYMGVLLVISVIIAGVSQTQIGDQIVDKMKHLIDQIAGGNTDKKS
jgi:pilus assembly protein Flp/PilA